MNTKDFKMNWRSTPSHGFLTINAAMLAHMKKHTPALLTLTSHYQGGHSFEEDCEWSRVACAFPSMFTISEVKAAIRTMKDYKPDIYEAHTGRKVKTEHSYKLQAIEFYKENINDYVAQSAWGSWHENVSDGYVGVFAVRGGRNPETHQYASDDEKYFLVPQDDYRNRTESGYVIKDSDIPWIGPGS